MTPASDSAPMSRLAGMAYALSLPAGGIALVFLPAGRLDWMAGWVFLGALTLAFGTTALVLARVNPMIFRARSRVQAGTERWDLALLALLMPAILAIIPLAALDAGRMGWSAVPGYAVILGYGLLLGGIAVTAWAQAVNPFFEPGVRVQVERDHQVIAAGPYRWVRHPGYAAAIAMFAGIALALGSWWALAPATLATALLILRTGLEDRLLQRDLPGYAAYARRTRFRLAPGAW